MVKMEIHPAVKEIIQEYEKCSICGPKLENNFLFCNSSLHDIVFLFERPNKIPLKIDPGLFLEKKVELSQNIFREWVSNTKAGEVVKEIKKRLGKKFVDSDFTDIIYITDVSKLAEYDTCESHLIHEFDILNPKYVFTFGNAAWKFAKKYYGLKEEKNLSDIHGNVYKDSSGKVNIISLLHSSKRISDIKNSYLTYMKEGIEKIFG